MYFNKTAAPATKMNRKGICTARFSQPDSWVRP
jgi:hypothetical protein